MKCVEGIIFSYKLVSERRRMVRAVTRKEKSLIPEQGCRTSVSNHGMHRYQSIGLVRVLEEIDFKSVTGVVPRMRTFVPEVDYTSVSGTFYLSSGMI